MKKKSGIDPFEKKKECGVDVCNTVEWEVVSNSSARLRLYTGLDEGARFRAHAP